MIPEGKYFARVVKGEVSENNKGNVQALIEFEIVEPGPEQGKPITAYRHFTDKALQYTVKDLVTCGHKGDDLSDLSMLGGEVQLVIVHEEYQGKTSAKVKFINAPARVMEPTKAKSWAETMKAKVAALKAAPIEGDPRPEPPPAAEGDLPF